jgi:hypothetical protein
MLSQITLAFLFTILMNGVQAGGLSARHRGVNRGAFARTDYQCLRSYVMGPGETLRDVAHLGGENYSNYHYYLRKINHVSTRGEVQGGDLICLEAVVIDHLRTDFPGYYQK